MVGTGQGIDAPGFRGSIGEIWFSPKRFESERLYEALGVRIFKKYIPTSGDWVLRKLKITLIKPGRLEDLKSWEFSTKVLEGIHVVGFFIFLDFLRALATSGDVMGLAKVIVLTLLINVYPIFTQRYNRIRIYRAIERMEKRKRGGPVN